MIISFRTQGTEDIWNGKNSKQARRTLPTMLWKKAQEKLDLLNYAVELDDIRRTPGNHLDEKKGDRSGQHCIWINTQYRICFVWTPAGPTDVEIVDYH